jgi:hypothetical protein
MLSVMEANMATDYDFKIGSGHYRGTGTRGLVVLVIICATRAGIFGGGGIAIYSGSPWLFQALRTYIDH